MLEVIIKNDYLFILFFIRIPQLYLTFTEGISFTCNVFFSRVKTKPKKSTCYLVTNQEKPSKLSFWCGLLCVKYSGSYGV